MAHNAKKLAPLSLEDLRIGVCALAPQQARDREQDNRYYARMISHGETKEEAQRLLKSLQDSRAARRKNSGV